MEKWWDFAAAGLALVAVGCGCLSLRTASRDDLLIGIRRPDSDPFSQAVKFSTRWNSIAAGFPGRRRFACSSACSSGGEALKSIFAHPILVANPCFTELLLQLPFLSHDEKIDQRNVDGGDGECGR